MLSIMDGILMSIHFLNDMLMLGAEEGWKMPVTQVQ